MNSGSLGLAAVFMLYGNQKKVQRQPFPSGPTAPGTTQAEKPAQAETGATSEQTKIPDQAETKSDFGAGSPEIPNTGSGAFAAMLAVFVISAAGNIPAAGNAAATIFIWKIVEINPTDTINF
uniref:hypothetical protein n=1 Tax=Candidatus Fimivicinus sp. TaxID=3056640 RepID=UPI003FEE89D8